MRSNGYTNNRRMKKPFHSALLLCLLLTSPLVADEPHSHSEGFDHVDPAYGKVLGQAAPGKTAPGTLLTLNQATDKQLAAYDTWFTENHKRHLGEVAGLVAIPTLAMDPKHADDLMKAGAYLKERLTAIGMKNATIHPAGGFPLVTAEWMEAKDQPTVVFYGHFDVQPVDPSRWDSDPFKATIRDGKLYGRGATDDKGFIIALMSSVEALLKLDGKLPVNVMFLFDGAEEFGSQSMPGWLAVNKEWISKADYGFNVDAMMYSDDQGLMWRGLRGGSDVEITLTSANTALHSGIYGGSAPNAAIAASKVIASMWNDDGSVAIDGFYDDLTPATPKQRKEIADAVAGVDEEAARKRLKIAEWIGEKHYTIIERTWIRPSLDVTGIKAGYIEGKASTIPFSAWFRVMARTGPGQDPVKVNKKIIEHVRKHVPWGVRVEMNAATFGSAPFFTEDDRNFQIGKTVLTEFFGKPPRILYVGGGVPALAYVPEAGGPNLVTFGFQRSDEGFHADNEFMRVESFKKGQRAYARLLHALVDQPQRAKSDVRQ